MVTKVTRYQATDGTLFNSYSAAEQYEFNLKDKSRHDDPLEAAVVEDAMNNDASWGADVEEPEESYEESYEPSYEPSYEE